MVIRGYDDPARNLAAWQFEWGRIHPAVRWFVWYALGLSMMIGAFIGIVIGLVIA